LHDVFFRGEAWNPISGKKQKIVRGHEFDEFSDKVFRYPSHTGGILSHFETIHRNTQG
jgi:hypothetical protein